MIKVLTGADQLPQRRVVWMWFGAIPGAFGLGRAQPQRRGTSPCDHELLIAKFRLKLKTVGKTTRPFRYDLNQIPYDYTVEVRNRFKGLDLIDNPMDCSPPAFSVHESLQVRILE